MRIVRSLIGLLILATVGLASDGQPAVRGRVVDEQGRPVEGADVDYFWRANGWGRDKDGQIPDVSNEEAMRERWGHLGEMQPASESAYKGLQRSMADGRFVIAEQDTRAYTLLAMDGERKRGALCEIPNDHTGQELTIRLGPLVRVHGTFASPNSKQLGWSYADVFVPDDPKRPLGFTRLTGCGTLDGRFELSLPVGRYVLCANNDDENWELRLAPSRELVLGADQLDVDLGVVPLTERPGIRYRERAAKKAGTLGDYNKHIGRRPPDWHVDEARGVPANVRIDYFKGKWVLVDFWGLTCTPCLAGMPKLIDFYQQHAAQRDRFEIVSICIDTEGDIPSLAALDKKLEPLIANAWGGRTLPFPVLLDKTDQSWLNFGIPGLGFMLLVDPDGNTVGEAELETLAEKLAR